MIYIDIEDKWEICIFTLYDDIDDLILALEKIRCSDVNRALSITEKYNSGFTYSNLKLRATVVYISPATSKSEWFNTLVHELKHVLSHICEYYDVSESGEDAAYLIGYIMKNIIRLL